MLTNYFLFDSRQSFNLTNQHIEYSRIMRWKKLPQDVKCIKDPTMSEEESSFENASYEARLKLVSPRVQFCNSYLTPIFTPVFAFAF